VAQAGGKLREGEQNFTEMSEHDKRKNKSSQREEGLKYEGKGQMGEGKGGGQEYLKEFVEIFFDGDGKFEEMRRDI
jgi:hypothetical protein